MVCFLCDAASLVTEMLQKGEADLFKHENDI